MYPFLGVESVTMTAFEAKDTRELKPPAKNISFIVLFVYMISIISMLLNVQSDDRYLMVYYKQWNQTGTATSSCNSTTSASASPPLPTLNFLHPRAETAVNNATRLMPVIATDNFHVPHLGGALNACLLYSAFSAANSALFVASRTLYGLGSSIQRDEPSRVLRFLATFGRVDQNGVPARAIIGSMFFAWVPFVSLGDADTAGTDNMQDILQSVGTTSCILVWASQALAFLRYHWWLRRHHTELKGQYRKFDRWAAEGGGGGGCGGGRGLSWLEFAQPWLAWFALVASLVILFVFASAGLWSENERAREELVVKTLDQYLGPGLLLVMFVGLKIVKRRWWVQLGDWEELRETLNDLNELVMPSSAPTEEIRHNGSLGHHSGSDGGETFELRANGDVTIT